MDTLPAIAILGAGSMGAAILSGLVQPGVAVSGPIRVTNRTEEKAAGPDPVRDRTEDSDGDSDADSDSDTGGGDETDSEPYEFLPADPWHHDGAREAEAESGA